MSQMGRFLPIEGTGGVSALALIATEVLRQGEYVCIDGSGTTEVGPAGAALTADSRP